MSYTGWGMALLCCSAASLLLAIRKTPVNWLLILLTIASFFTGGVLLFLGIILKH